MNHIHSIDRRKIRTVISFETLFRYCDHLLNWNVKFAAELFEESVYDVIVNNKHISIDADLNL